MSARMTTMGAKPIVAAIAAMDAGRVIGRGNEIPWRIPEDMRRFAELTRGHTVLMGRRTYESLPARFRPLPDRKNVVASRSAAALPLAPGVEACTDAAAYVRNAKASGRAPHGDYLWIIGGAQIYESTLAEWDEVFLTLVPGAHEGDACFPAFESGYVLLAEEQGAACRFLHYRRREGRLP